MKVYSIGRNEDCSIVIDNPLVSRRQALLKVYNTGKMQLVSLGTNGTYVNGVKLAQNVPYPVKRKDVISFAHAKKLDWDLVPNPFKYVKYVLYGILALIIFGLIYTAIYKLLINKKVDETKDVVTEMVDTPNKEKSKDNSKAEPAKNDKKKAEQENSDKASDSRFFPVKVYTPKVANKVETKDKNNQSASGTTTPKEVKTEKALSNSTKRTTKEDNKNTPPPKEEKKNNKEDDSQTIVI